MNALTRRLLSTPAWAALAAHGVTALRDRIGHSPSDRERRALWDALWRAARREPTADR